MKRTVFLLPFCAAVALLAVAPSMLGQNETIGRKLFFAVKPLVGGDLNSIQAQSDTGVGLKMWTYQATSTRQGSKGQKFTGMIVGKSPFTDKGTTTITMQIVPVILKIGGDTFDPTVPDNSCAAGKVPLKLLQQSPMVLPVKFKMNGVNVGKTQQSDAFQRASFWTPISKNGGTYHNKLKVVTLSPITLDPGSNAAIVAHTACGPFGAVDIYWWDSYVTGTIIPSLKSQGVGPTTFPIFMFYNAAWYFGNSSQCCVGGYHSAFGNPVQTHSSFLFDLSGAFGPGALDTVLLSHEVNEWQDDPLGANPAPVWGHTGQVTGCQNDLEIADPLWGTSFPNVKMPNGYTYHLQELAFYSWFYGPPSLGAGKKFSDNGTFTSTQGVCK